MIVKQEGHINELKNFETDGSQTITFVKKGPASEGSTEMITEIPGTTNEEVLKALINRMQYLNTKFYSRENSIVITRLEEALMWLGKRTADRIERGVEGKHIA